MKYVGIQTQKRRNNIRSSMMLFLFPCVLLFLTWVFFWFLHSIQKQDEYTYIQQNPPIVQSFESFYHVAPWVILVCLVWFLIAYFSNTALIKSSTGSRSLERRENKRVYNLVENLCMANSLPMPKINLIEDDSLNAFASGINKNTYTISLSRGIINRLNDEELEAVIAHELTHIRNNDVKVLVVSIVFVGIFSFITQILFRVLFKVRIKSDNKNGGGIVVIMLLVLLLAAIGYLISTLMRFAISRQREFMADAGSAELTRNPQALASALRKIANDPYIEAVEQSDVAQLFIENPLTKNTNFINSLFATHPTIEKRIQVLEQF